MQETIELDERYAVAQPLTREQLCNTRWIFALEGEAPASTTFFFTPNGRIEGYYHPNESSWTLKEDVLRIFQVSGRVTWILRRVASDREGDRPITFEGRLELYPTSTTKLFLSAFVPPSTTRASPVLSAMWDKESADSSVRMVIWDLDETFWNGTLSEAGVTPIASNIAIIKTLTDRGIMNAVCSKNHFEEARATLISLDVWDDIIFPRIAFAPKGPAIQDIIAASQLRAASIVFIDDNDINLNEAVHYNPGLQIASPALLPTLLDDPRFAGKPDPSHSRLAQYRVLEQKQADRSTEGQDNAAFLIHSQIKVSFHYDVIENFARIHDLVNRTNQLNFTKNRWPEDAVAAVAAYQAEMATAFNTQSGYIRVSDRYGDYGICGFYLIKETVARHFVFSCRAMNMGVEQFVWAKLHRPHVQRVGDVVSDIAMAVDWIALRVEAGGAAADTAIHGTTSICIRGACDLAMMGHYLHGRGRLILEHPYPYQGWAIYQTTRTVAGARDACSPANRDLLAKLPGLPKNRFESAIVDGSADFYVLSFSQEVMGKLYRARSTGFVFNMNLEPFGSRDLTTVGYEELVQRNLGSCATEEEWAFLRSNLEYAGHFDQAILREDIRSVFELLKGKPTAILMLNSTVGRATWLLDFFRTTNEIVRAEVALWNRESLRQIKMIEVDAILRDERDLADDGGGGHFVKDVYRQIAEHVSAFVVGGDGAFLDHTIVQ